MDKYIFISIPKTGTNSVHEIMGNTKYNHITANTVRNMIGEKEYNSKESFCFIRNPIELVKSWYYYHKYSPNVIRQDVKQFYPNSIEEWVFNMNCKTHWEIPIHKKYNPQWDLSISPLEQNMWVFDKNGSKIVKNVYNFDDINLVIEKLFKVKLKQKNTSSKDDYILNTKTEDKIKELFQKDIDFYKSLS